MGGVKMKSYTDIEQSRKLAEILPIDSADMHYSTWTILNGEFIVSPNQGNTIENLRKDYGNQIIPCWSLAALLNIMPKHIKQDDGRTYKFHIVNDDGIVIQRWSCSYIAKDYHNRAEYLSDPKLKYPTNIYGGEYEDILDAAFEIILKLHEQKLI